MVEKYRRLIKRLRNRWEYWQLLGVIERSGGIVKNKVATCKVCKPEESCSPGHHCKHTSRFYMLSWRLRRLDEEYRRI
jgi:hypothetical protein